MAGRPHGVWIDAARRLLERHRPRPPAVLKGMRLRVLIAGYDLKFITGIIDKLSRIEGCEVRIDKWRSFTTGNTRQSRAANSWADVVVCEWCGANAVWYSRHKRRGQRLIVRLHRHEMTTGLPDAIDPLAVDQLVTVSPNFQTRVRERLNNLPTERVVAIPNYVDSSVFHRAKIQGANVHLGLVGGVPRRKRIDLALDILRMVRESDNRFCLFVKTKMPWDLPWLWSNAEERKYYKEVLRRIRSDRLLEGSVVFDLFGDDVASWLRRIGTVLSTSEAESFHVGALEGMMSGAPCVFLPWRGGRHGLR